MEYFTIYFIKPASPTTKAWDGNYSHEIKRCLLLGRTVMTNLESIFKSRDITLLTKIRLVKAMIFLVVMYGCESWTVKKAEYRWIDVFELWWRLLRVPWTARRSSQSILKEISPGCSLEGMMLKPKLQPQYFGHLMQRTDSLEKTLMLGQIEGGRRGGRQRMKWLDLLAVQGTLKSLLHTPQFKSINSLVLSFLYSPTLTSIYEYWKNHSLAKRIFVVKVMSLFFNMLS